ncbi:MAG: alpha/beta fold hydrolase [Parachlamydiaceae bacterium]|nr:alpha/beta fold hydrolase [Parachlamydiaceae bacterium]
MKNTEIREAVTLVNEGEKIFGILHRPLKKQKVPAVLICSGFAGNKCGKSRLFVRLAQELVKQGIAVFRFDYRGAGDSEGEFQDITIEGKLSDTLTCLDFLTRDLQIDPTRIGLLGRSLGGVISILAANRYKTIKSLVLWAPVYNSSHWQNLWKAFQANKLDKKQKIEIQSLPAGVPNLQFLRQFFQLDMEKELMSLEKIPLLHIEADRDSIVKGEHGKAYRSIRQQSDNTHFIQLENSDHDFSDFNDQIIAVRETCQWYKQTLFS